MSVSSNLGPDLLGTSTNQTGVDSLANTLSWTLERKDSTTSSLHLPIQPPFRRRSHDSTALSLLSNEQRDKGLPRRLSNASNFSVLSIPSVRKTWRQRLRDVYDENYGAVLVLVSQVFGAGMTTATRLLEQPGAHGSPMHPFQILFVRQTLTALLCTAYALTTRSIPHFPLGPPDRKIRLLLICRGLFGFLGVFGMYFSLLYLPLSEATVLTFLAPVLTCYVCSFMIQGETFTRQQQLAGFVSLAGVIFIAQPVTLFSSSNPSSSSVSHTPPSSILAESGISSAPNATNASYATDAQSSMASQAPTPTEHLLAIGIAMVGVVGATGAYTIIRAIGPRAHAFISVNYFSVSSAIVSLIALVVFPGVSFRLPQNIIEWSLLLGLGLCGFIMQGLLTMGLAYRGPTLEPSHGLTGGHTTGDEHSDDDHDNDREVAAAAEVSGNQDIEMQYLSGPRFKLQQFDPTSTRQETREKRKNRMVKTRGTRSNYGGNTRRGASSGTKATSMVYTSMLFALAADKVVFGSTPDAWSWVGSLLILAGAIWVAAAKETDTENESNASRVKNARANGRFGHDADGSASAMSNSAIPRGTDVTAGQQETVGLLTGMNEAEEAEEAEGAGETGETEEEDEEDIGPRTNPSFR